MLGAGGMGTVYRALDLTLDHQRALKVLTADLTANRDFRERFQRESRLAAQLEDEGVVPIYGAGEAEGRLYIAMRLVRGSDLHRLVDEEGPLNLDRVVSITAAVAKALDAAHAREIIHRDVKPANILTERSGEGERIYLTDFGISRPATATTAITSTGQLLGTPDYISPEQIDGARAGVPADVYALGCVVCFMLTGESPFHRDTAVATLYAHANAERPRPSLLLPELPAGVDEVLARATAVDPDERFASAGELAAALSQAAGSSETAGVPVTPRTRELPLEGGSRRRWLIAAGVAVALAAAAVTVAVVGGDDSPDAVTTLAAAKTEKIGIGDAVDSIVVGELNVLVGSQADSSLTTINPETGKPEPSPKTVNHPTSVAVGFGSIWVTSGTDDQLLRYGPDNRNVATEIDVGHEPVDVAVGEDWVWVVNRADETVTQIDPLDNSTKATIDVAAGPKSIVTAGSVAWVASPSTGQLTKLDASVAPTSAASIAPGGSPADLAIADGSLWQVDSTDGTLLERSLEDGRRIGDPITLGGELVALAVGPGGLWVADKARDVAIRVDPPNDELEIVSVGHRPAAIDVGAGSVWVASAGERTVTRIDR